MLDHHGPFSGAHGGPKRAQNNTKMAENITKMALHGPKCPYMTPNGPKTLPMGILHDIFSCWTTLEPFRHHGGPKMAQNITKMAQNGSKSPEWLKMALHDPK